MLALNERVEPRLHEPLDRLFGGLLKDGTADGVLYVGVDKIECGLRSVFHDSGF